MSDSIIKLHDAIENKPPVGQEHYGIRIKRLIGGLKEERERLRTENEQLKQQAQVWKQEARTMQNTVAECYQAVTGSTGEPGSWNGANPVRELVRERDRLRDIYYASTELFEVAQLRGDNELPHPADDPLLWTARMQDAWDDLETALYEQNTHEES